MTESAWTCPNCKNELCYTNDNTDLYCGDISVIEFTCFECNTSFQVNFSYILDSKKIVERQTFTKEINHE